MVFQESADRPAVEFRDDAWFAPSWAVSVNRPSLYRRHVDSLHLWWTACPWASNRGVRPRFTATRARVFGCRGDESATTSRPASHSVFWLPDLIPRFEPPSGSRPEVATNRSGPFPAALDEPWTEKSRSFRTSRCYRVRWAGFWDVTRSVAVCVLSAVNALRAVACRFEGHTPDSSVMALR